MPSISVTYVTFLTEDKPVLTNVGDHFTLGTPSLVSNLINTTFIDFRVHFDQICNIKIINK